MVGVLESECSHQQTVKPVGTEGVAEGLDWFGGCVGTVGADPEMSGQKT